ncbi:hypothetical protein EZS27_039910 [termite gut metagenome]|uniref:Calcium-binding protein P n=1 Tax=termite gut metagenome TaxID=433724 RepID=A0A5J4PHW4_9ZZZZ
MRMKRLLKYLLTTILIACPLAGTILSSCSEDDGCSMSGRSMLRCNVYAYKDGTLTRAALTKLTVTAFDTDSIIINAQTNVQDVSLPLRYTQEITVFVLHYGDEGTMKDTVTVQHNNISSFISLECGYDMQQSVTDVAYTKHALDSIFVRNINSNVNGQENLQLFYTTD